MDHVALSSHCASPPRPGTGGHPGPWVRRRPRRRRPGIVTGPDPAPSRPGRVPPPASPPSTTGAPVPPVPAGSTRSSDDPRKRVLTREIVYQGYDLGARPTISRTRPAPASRGAPGLPIPARKTDANGEERTDVGTRTRTGASTSGWSRRSPAPPRRGPARARRRDSVPDNARPIHVITAKLRLHGPGCPPVPGRGGVGQRGPSPGRSEPVCVIPGPFDGIPGPGPGWACAMRAQRDMVHPASRRASSARRNPPVLDSCEPVWHDASPGDITESTPPGAGGGRKARAGPGPGRLSGR